MAGRLTQLINRYGAKARRKAQACLEARKLYFSLHELEDSNGEALCQIGGHRMRFEDSTGDHKKKRWHGDDTMGNFLICCLKCHGELDRNPERKRILEANRDINCIAGGVLEC